MHIRKICSILTIICLFGWLGLYFWGSPLALYRMEQDTLIYLEQEGYQPSHIQSIKVYYDRKEQTKYICKVIFKESPETEQRYAYDVTGMIHGIE